MSILSKINNILTKINDSMTKIGPEIKELKFDHNYAYQKEIVVGQYIDGRPIYQYYSKGGWAASASANNWFTFYNNFATQFDVDILISFRLKRDEIEDFQYYLTRIDNTNLQIYFYKKYILYSNMLYIVEYTKTTDQATITI